MLEHVIEVQILDFILCCVDLLIRVLKVGLDHES